MEAIGASETSAHFYQSTLRHTPEGGILQTLLRIRDIKQLSPLKSLINGKGNLIVPHD
jgi:hypothetical protein